MPEVTLTVEEMAVVRASLALGAAQLEYEAAKTRAEVDPLVKAPGGEPDPVIVRAYDRAVRVESEVATLRALIPRFESV